MIIDFLVTICISPLQSLIVNRARSKPGFYFSAIEAHNRPARGGRRFSCSPVGQLVEKQAHLEPAVMNGDPLKVRGLL